MAEPSSSPQSFQTQRRVEFSDTDMAGIAHFSAFFRWMEAAEHELLRSLGLSVYTRIDDETALSFPRVNATCDYRSPARCEDLLDIAVSVARIGGKSVTYAFRFSRDETLIAEGKMTSVCCRVAAGHASDSRPEAVTLPERIVAGLRPLTGA